MVYAYAGLWTAGAVYEDHNAAVAHEDQILEPSSPEVHDWAWFRRPLTMASYRLTNNLGGGVRTAHLESLALHLAVVAAVGGLAWTLGLSWPVAVGLMALHPLASESVVYLSARSELLATLAVVLALWALCAGHLLLGAVASFASFGCNPATGASLIGLIPLCLWRGWIRSWWRDEALGLTAMLALAVVVGLGASWNTPEVTQAVGAWWIYLLRQLAATVALAGLVVVPWPLVVDHGFAWQTGAMIAARMTILVAALTLAVALRRRMPALLLLVAWWVCGFGARLWIPTWNYVTEHHAYLPLVGVALVAADLAEARRC